MGVSASVVASDDERRRHSDNVSACAAEFVAQNNDNDDESLTNSDEDVEDDDSDLRGTLRALRNAIEQSTTSSTSRRNKPQLSSSSSSWRVVFDSSRHGLSFGALTRACVENALAPLALLVEPNEEDDAPVRAVYLPNGVPDGPRCEMFGDSYAACAFELVAAPTTPKKTFRDVSRPVGSNPSVYFAYGFDAHVNGFGVFGRPGRHVVFLDDKLEDAHYDYGARSVSIGRVVVTVRLSEDGKSQTKKKTTTASTTRAAETYRIMSQYTESSINRDVVSR